MKNEITNEQLLTAILGIDKRFDGIDSRLDGMDKRFDRIEEQIEDLALMTKVQFDEVDRKIDILSLRTRGLRLWS